MQACSILSLATAVPPHVIEQSEAKRVAREAFGCKALFDRLSGVFDNAGIARRHIAAPHQWYATGHGWRDRNAVYLQAAEDLFAEAATAALERAGLDAGEIDGIVTVSTTGIATPSLEARVAKRMGFREDVPRVPVFGLGCAGGVNGLALASRLAVAEPGTRWLFVTVETCSISIRLDSDDPAAVVATALFGDGAAAAVVTAGEHSVARIRGSAEKLWPDTLRIMGWDVEDPGLAVVFDRAIPPFIESELAEAVDGMCAQLGIGRSDIDGSVRARAPDRAGPAEPHDDDRVRTGLHLRRPAARSRVILSILILAFVTLERLVELMYARRNTRRLLERGAREHAPGHYPLIVAVHASWLTALWWLAPTRPIDGFFLALFILIELGRAWVLITLGPRWTTRIIVLPDEPLVTGGPYRFLNHPNYWVVAGEIAILPLVFGLWLVALIFTLLNAAVLTIRIREENRALSR
jgi:alkylresorcinol/alkylpyrone synthase